MSLKGILGGIDVEQYSTDQSPPGLLGTYKRLDGIKGCELVIIPGIYFSRGTFSGS